MKDDLNKLDESVEILPIPIAAARQAQDTSVKYPVGIAALDDSIDGGFREGDFTVITGVPGSGKTTLARMLTTEFSARGIASCWFSYEMTIAELWDAFQKMGADTSMISYVPIRLEDDYDWVLRVVERAVKEYAVKAVFIDTLGDVVRSVQKQAELSNYATYLAQMCKDLRQYAIKNNLMIFVIAHATKQTRSNTDETNNADIANSNGIPAAATNIFHVWRDKTEEDLSYIKIGKSRRDGTKHNRRFKFRFTGNKLLQESSDYTTLEEDMSNKV